MRLAHENAATLDGGPLDDAVHRAAFASTRWRCDCVATPLLRYSATPLARVSGRRPQEAAAVLDLVATGSTVSAVAEAAGIARPRLSAMRHRSVSRPRVRTPRADVGLVDDIRARDADLATNGYRVVHTLLSRETERTGHERPIPNPFTA